MLRPSPTLEYLMHSFESHSANNLNNNIHTNVIVPKISSIANVYISNVDYSQNIPTEALENNQIYDVTLRSGIDSVGVTAHRSVLAAASEYFSAMFRLDMQERCQEEIVINGVSGATLKSLVNFCYTKIVILNWESVLEILPAASLLSFLWIEEECKCFFAQQLLRSKNAPEVCLEILQIAEKYQFDALKEQSYAAFRDNFRSIMKTVAFCELDYPILNQILNSNEPFNAKEQDIFEAAMYWVNFDLNQREAFVPEILRLIRLTQFDYAYLAEYVRPICLASNCMDLLTDSMFQRNLQNSHQFGVFQLETANRSSPEKLVVFGVSDKDDNCSIESYCLLLNKWSMENQIRLVGACKPIKPRFTVTQNDVYMTTEYTFGKLNVYHYNLKTENLTHLNRMECTRNYYVLAVMAGRLYILGGTDLYESTTKTVYCLNVTTNQWSNCPNMINCRAKLGVAVHGGYLYAIGGHNDEMGTLSSVERYHPLRNCWSLIQPMLQRRTDPGVAVLHDKIYVLGGRESMVFFDSVERFDPQRMEWTMIASLSVARSLIATAVYENKIFAIGGLHLRKNSQVVEQYIFGENKWIQLEPLNLERKANVAVVTRR